MERFEKQIGEDPKHIIIWLHGLGADGYDFQDIPTMLNPTIQTALKYIFPHAPIRPVTLNGGIEMRAWFDVLNLEADGRYDRDGIVEAETLVGNIIEECIHDGYESKNIVLAGFSQGAATILFTGLRYPKPLGGLIALSSFLPEHEWALETMSASNQSVPIFMGHGTQDPLVKYEWGKMTQAVLTESGYSVDWHEYPMAHSVCPEELEDLGHWCHRIL